MVTLNLKQGEAKTIVFAVSQNNAALNLTDCTFAFQIKATKSGVAAVSKVDGDFTKTDAANGNVSVFLTAANTNQTPGSYYGELQITFTGSPSPVDKSADIAVTIEEAVITP